jgi:transposase
VEIGLDEMTPEHSTISRTRRLSDLDTHRVVFRWVLNLLADRRAIEGKRVAIDATTLRPTPRCARWYERDTGESYEQILVGLAKASGLETPTREDLARLDRKCKKRTSNQEWKGPSDQDARIAKMKDVPLWRTRRTVDLDIGAVLAVTLQGADQGKQQLWRRR